MIQITLNFTSIEAARAALLDIPTSVLVGAPPVDAPKSVQAPAPAAGQPTAKESAAPKKTAAEKAPPAPSVETAAPASTAAETVDYAVLQKAVFTLAGKSREAAASVAAGFGVKTFKELPQDKWADALAAVNEKLAIVEA